MEIDGAVDLDEVDRRAAQQLEAGVAGADVVERDLEAELAQPRDLAHDVPEPRRGVLGQLEHELVRLAGRRRARPRPGSCPASVSRSSDFGETLRNSSVSGGQVARQSQRAAAGDLVQQVRVAELLGEVEELARAAEAEAGVRARQRLVAEDGVALEVPDRLERDVELAVLEQLAEPADAVRVRQRRARGDLVEDDDRALRRALGLVDRGVGLLAQQREVPREEDDRAPMPTLRLTPGSATWPRPRGLLERHLCAVGVGVREQDRELVTAEPEARVPPCGRPRSPRRSRAGPGRRTRARGGRCRT